MSDTPVSYLTAACFSAYVDRELAAGNLVLPHHTEKSWRPHFMASLSLGYLSLDYDASIPGRRHTTGIRTKLHFAEGTTECETSSAVPVSADFMAALLECREAAANLLSGIWNNMLQFDGSEAHAEAKAAQDAYFAADKARAEAKHARLMAYKCKRDPQDSELYVVTSPEGETCGNIYKTGRSGQPWAYGYQPGVRANWHNTREDCRQSIARFYMADYDFGPVPVAPDLASFIK